MKDKSMSFKEKFFKFLDKSVESSKKAFHKAGEKISDFSDKSVMKIELTRMTGKLEKLYASLGEFVFEKRSSAKKTAADTETLKEYYTQIEELLSEIEAKKNAVNSLENESADTKPDEKAKPARAAVRSTAVKSGQKAEQNAGRKTSSAGKTQVSKKKTSAASAPSAEKTVAVKKSVKRASAKSSAAASASTKKTAERTKKSAAVKSSSKKASD